MNETRGPFTAACLRFLTRPEAALGTLILVGLVAAGSLPDQMIGMPSPLRTALVAAPDTLRSAGIGAALSGALGFAWALLALVMGGVEAARRLTALPLPLAAAAVAAAGGSEPALIAAIGLSGAPQVAVAVHEAARRLSRGDLAAGARAEGEGEARILLERLPPNLLGVTLSQAWSTLPFAILAILPAGMWATGTGAAFGGWGAMIVGADADRLSMMSAAIVIAVTLFAAVGVGRGLSAAAEVGR